MRLLTDDKYFLIGLDPLIPVGFRVTFQCPDNHVLSSDYYVVPRTTIRLKTFIALIDKG